MILPKNFQLFTLKLNIKQIVTKLQPRLGTKKEKPDYKVSRLYERSQADRQKPE